MSSSLGREQPMTLNSLRQHEQTTCRSTRTRAGHEQTGQRHLAVTQPPCLKLLNFYMGVTLCLCGVGAFLTSATSRKWVELDVEWGVATRLGYHQRMLSHMGPWLACNHSNHCDKVWVIAPGLNERSVRGVQTMLLLAILTYLSGAGIIILQLLRPRGLLELRACRCLLENAFAEFLIPIAAVMAIMFMLMMGELKQKLILRAHETSRPGWAFAVCLLSVLATIAGTVCMVFNRQKHGCLKASCGALIGQLPSTNPSGVLLKKRERVRRGLVTQPAADIQLSPNVHVATIYNNSINSNSGVSHNTSITSETENARSTQIACIEEEKQIPKDADGTQARGRCENAEQSGNQYKGEDQSCRSDVLQGKPLGEAGRYKEAVGFYSDSGDIGRWRELSAAIPSSSTCSQRPVESASPAVTASDPHRLGVSGGQGDSGVDKDCGVGSHQAGRPRPRPSGGTHLLDRLGARQIRGPRPLPSGGPRLLDSLGSHQIRGPRPRPLGGPDPLLENQADWPRFSPSNETGRYDGQYRSDCSKPAEVTVTRAGPHENEMDCENWASTSHNQAQNTDTGYKTGEFFL
ncbi:hypothetical protein ElyMa_004294700 [Elysia marginata]|uniref:Claudin n=1 Tax=Elysia marginata TaxID=1093978 RepID=A0AAV4H0F9_9GAST|nr:hypothetical protein ElyMa_004294700 [Elysia marginata]